METDLIFALCAATYADVASCFIRATGTRPLFTLRQSVNDICSHRTRALLLNAGQDRSQQGRMSLTCGELAGPRQVDKCAGGKVQQLAAGPGSGMSGRQPASGRTLTKPQRLGPSLCSDASPFPFCSSVTFFFFPPQFTRGNA